MTRKILSLKIFAGAILLFFLQLVPWLGFFIGAIGTLYLCGLLLILAMLFLFYEAITGIVSRVFIIIPILGFGAYYSIFFHQMWQIKSYESEYQKNNPVNVYSLNQEKEHLVTVNAGRIVENYNIRVAFGKNYKGYRSHRLFTQKNCNKIKGNFTPFGVHKNNVIYRDPPTPSESFGRIQTREGVCKISIPEAPTKRIISVDVTNERRGIFKTSIAERLYTLNVNDKKLAEFHTGTVYRYGVFPLPIIACVMPIGCEFGFYKSFYRLKTNPITIPQNIDIDPVAVMLGLKKYSAEDYMVFEEDLENSMAIKKALGN